MLFSTVGQAWAFLGTVYGGLAIGLFYDVTRIVRILLRAGRGATVVIDLLFWLAAAAAMGLTIGWLGAREVRGFLFLGFACGWALWALALSGLVMKVFLWLRRLGRKVAQTRVARRVLR